MSRFLRKIIVLIIFTVCSVSIVFGAQLASDGQPITNDSNDLLAAVVPISYGDEAFRQKILESTGGVREPVGLVLSGGSARAFAHIGVLKYMEEQGIVPDFIISNSMGSIIGMLYAAGLSPDQILDICSNVPLGSLFDLTIPFKGGLLDPSKFSAVLKSYLGQDLLVEDLPIPIMIICEDLATKRQVRIMEGDFYEVMNAAYALPVYYPPVEYKGHLLIDGGMTNLVPLELAYDYADFNVVSTTFYDVDTLNLKNPLTVLNTAFDIGKRRQGVTELLDHGDDAIWIRCDVESTSFMEFSAALELAEKGYQSAAEHAEEFARISYTNPVSPQLQIIRDEHQPKLNSAQYFYNLYNHAYQKDFSQILGLGIFRYRYPGDDFYLRDDVIFGPEYGLRWDNLELSLIGGASWRSFDGIEKIYPSVALSIDYYLLKFMRISLDGTVAWDRNSWVPTSYIHQGFELKFRQFDRRLNLTLVESFEMVLNPERGDALENQDLYMILSAGIRGTWKNDGDYPFGIGFGGGYQLAGWFNRNFIYAKLNFELPLPADLWITMRGTGRFAVDGLGNVPFFNEDGFRTNDKTIRNQGWPNNSNNNPSPYLLVTSFTFGWTPSSFKPSFGEFMLFENNTISLYCDLLWNRIDKNPWVPYVSAGIELSTNSALIGLRELPISIYVGFDQPSYLAGQNPIVWGVWFGIID